MDAGDFASIIVAIIAATVAIATSRNASKAQKATADAQANAAITTSKESSRTDMEKEAYERARAFDTETIRRQDEEIKELREKVSFLENESHEQKIQIRMQRIRIEHLEQRTTR